MKPIVAAALAALLFTQPALAQPAPAGAGQGRGARGDGARAVMAKLNLNDVQQEKIEKLRTEMQRKNIETQSKIRLARVDMRELMRAENPSRSAIEKKIRAVSDLELELKITRLDHMLAVREVLTPEQRKTWKDGMRDARWENRGRGGRRWPPPGADDGE
jgi:Spy/CpxP family protein refolding chaperone